MSLIKSSGLQDIGDLTEINSKCTLVLTPQSTFEYLKKVITSQSIIGYFKIVPSELEEYVKYTIDLNNSEVVDPLSYFNLGNMYEHKIGVKKDLLKACIWYLKSAELGNMYGMYYLGRFYGDRFLDINSSKEWFHKCIEVYENTNVNDDIFFDECVCRLGKLHYNSNDYNNAILWYKKSVDKGNKNSMFEIARMYSALTYNAKTKEEIKIYKEKIKEWYIIASDNDHVCATYNLAGIYYREKNYVKALEYYKKIKNQYNVKDEMKECEKEIFKMKKLDIIYNDVETDKCACCLDTLKNTDSPIIIFICGHSFHYKCVANVNTCPTCRRETNLEQYIKNEEEDEEEDEEYEEDEMIHESG